MAATNINRVVLTGNLTADPELRSLPSGTSVCSCASPATRAARTAAPANGRTSPTTSTSPCGARRARTPPAILSKGRPVAIDGRLEWREWETQDGAKRQAIDIIADSVQFLGSRDDASGGGGFAGNGGSRGSDVPVDEGDFQPAPAGGAPATTTFRSSSSEDRHASVTTRAREPRFLMAKARGRGKPVRRRDKRGGPGSGRRKPCQHCRDKVEQVDYKDVALAAQVHLREGQDPLAPDHRLLPAPPGPDRARRQARARARAAALRERGRPRRRAPRGAAATATATRRDRPMPEAILLQDVESLGEQGAVVDVSKGYLRNYLIPRKLAQPATKGAIETVRQRQAAEERAAREAVEKAQENVNLLNRTVLTIPQQAGADGRLFGSVTAQDIAERDPRSARPADRQTQRAPAGADQERRHLHGRRRGRRRRHRHDQDDGRRQEIARRALGRSRLARARPRRAASRPSRRVRTCVRAGASSYSCSRFAGTAPGRPRAPSLDSPDR